MMISEHTTFFVQLYLAVLFSGAVGFVYRQAWSWEHGRKHSYFEQVWGLEPKDRTTPVVFDAALFPASFACLFVFTLWYEGWNAACARLFHTAGYLVPTMSVYYTALLLLMPLLRRRLSARACATTWLLPTALYYSATLAPLFPMPRVVLYCPKELTRWLIPVWLAGFVFLFAAALLSHVRFSRRILQNASDECDEQVLALWRQETEQFGQKTPIRLVRCALTETPFSTGSRRHAMTVLPARPFTEEELRLIFRHELHHIRRRDANAKLFFAFLRSLFWFHPLVWIAARQSARDMELSCDEIVLDGADPDTRRRYASLLLHTAGALPGFTTCLSADAASLRYRLKNIMRERSLHRGTVFLMALLFTCIMFHGTFAFSDERCLLGDLFVDDGTLDHFGYEVYSHNTHAICSQNEAQLKEGGQEALLAYLRSLSVEHLAVSSDRLTATPQSTPRLYLSDKDNSRQGIWLCDRGATVYNWNETENRATFYYIRGGIDWQRIADCFEPYTPDL